MTAGARARGAWRKRWAVLAVLIPGALGAQSLRGFSIPDSAWYVSNRAAPTDCFGLFKRLIPGRQRAAPPAPTGTPGKRPIITELYADGNIRSAVAEGGGGQTAAGSLGFNARTGCTTIDLLVNAAGTRDARREGFGATVLVPGAGGSLGAGLVDLRLLFGKATSRRRVGARGYASASSSRWQKDDESDPVDVVVGGLGSGLFWGISGTLPATEANESTGRSSDVRKPVAALIDVGVAYRAIGGDLVRAGADSARAWFGVDNFRRAGAEVGLLVTFGGLKAGVTYYYFRGDMLGMSRGQLVAGIAVQTTLASGLLNP